MNSFFQKLQTVIIRTVIIVIVGFVILNILFLECNRYEEGPQAKAKAEIRTLMTAVEMYKSKFDQYPDSLNLLVKNPKGVKFLDQDKIPNDPWNNPYVYTLLSPKEFAILSYGEDGRPGGTGYDKDIDSTKLKGEE